MKHNITDPHKHLIINTDPPLFLSRPITVGRLPGSDGPAAAGDGCVGPAGRGVVEVCAEAGGGGAAERGQAGTAGVEGRAGFGEDRESLQGVILQVSLQGQSYGMLATLAQLENSLPSRL